MEEFNVNKYLEELVEATKDMTTEEAQEYYEKDFERLSEEEYSQVLPLLEIIEECDCDKESPIIADLNNVQGFQLNKDCFYEGVDGVSKICGQYVALKSVGMSDKDIVDIITNIMNTEFNLTLNKDTCTSNEIVSKNQVVVQQQNQI